MDYIVSDHLGWKWQWEPRVRGWISLGTIEVPKRGSDDEEELETKYVGFLKPATYNIIANSMSVKRAMHFLGANRDSTVIVHFDPAQTVGWYGPAYQELNEEGHDAEVVDVRFLDEIRAAMRIDEKDTIFHMHRLAIGVDASDNDQDKLIYNPGTMKVIGQSMLDEAYLNTLFSPKQEAIFKENVLKNADHVLKTILDLPDRGAEFKSDEYEDMEDFKQRLTSDELIPPTKALHASNKITAPSQDIYDAVYNSLASGSRSSSSNSNDKESGAQ